MNNPNIGEYSSCMCSWNNKDFTQRFNLDRSLYMSQILQLDDILLQVKIHE